MTINWEFSPETTTGVAPAVHEQLLDVSGDVLTLRNPWIGDSVSMAKMYTSLTMVLICVNTYIWVGSDIFAFAHGLDYYLAFIILISSFVFTPFLWYRIFLIKRLTNFYFSRKLNKVIYLRKKTLIQFDWAQTEGGIFVRNEFGGAGITTNLALAFGPKPAAGQEKNRIVLWVNSNHSHDPDPRYVAQVWEYIRQFMEEGPDKVPAPGDPIGGTPRSTGFS
ncbi:hypothetical protein [Achromobacter mucicolens]|uniref:hypothetical protein n=1 Tax=Achromobacter mucicolens TaxID=1389922 RepID=UPI001F0B9197|nr:hypothetical protein [Achromobacter mucicolens]